MKESKKEMIELRDRIAIAAMQGLLRHWERFDENGCSVHDANDADFGSLAQAAMCEGWGSEHPVKPACTYAYRLASDAYYIAEEMLRCRKDLEDDPVAYSAVKEYALPSDDSV